MRIRLQVLFAVVLCGALSLPGVAATPMAEHVPGDALLYVGWRGADDAPDGFEQTHLKALLDESNFGPLLTRTLPQLLDHYAADEPQVAMVRQTAGELWPTMWQRPWALYLTGVDTQMMAHGGPPMPQLGLVIASEGDDAALREQIEQFQAMGLPIQMVEGDGYLGLISDVAASPAEADSLAESDKLGAALAPLSDDGVAVGYVDMQGVLALVREQVEATADPSEVEKVGDLYDTLGLDGVHSIAFTAGFAGPNWQMQMFVNAPAPRRGLLDALIVSEPIEDQHLALVPRTSTWMSASRLDLAKLYDQGRAFVEQIEPSAQAEIDEMLFMASAMTGVDIEADLLRGLGPVWIGYRDSNVAGPTSWMGVTIANPLRDAERVNVAMQGLSQAISDAAKPEWDNDPHFRAVTFEHAGTTVHSFAVPFIQPTWAVHGDTLHIGLVPQAVTNAIDFAEADGETILDNEHFQALREQLGNNPVNGIEFTDLPRTVQGTYSGALLFGQLASSLGIAMNPHDDGAAIALLPSLGRLLPHIEPAGQVAWVDDAGWHARTLSPFPGSVLLGHEGSANPSIAALSMGIMLPALGSTRQSARRMQSNTQSRGIHQAMVMYAQGAPGGKLPDDIWVLLEGHYFPPDYVISPHAPVNVPMDFDTWDDADRARWIRENASYVLIPGLTDDLDMNTVAVFERPDHAAGNTIAVTFNDNSTQVMPVEQVRERVMEQTGKTLEELIERQQTYSGE